MQAQPARAPRMYTGLKTKQHASTALGVGTRITDYPTVFAVEKGSPAEHAGFRVGDVILAVNGFDPLKARQRAVLKGPDQHNLIRVRRGLAEVTLSMTPTAPKPIR